MKRFFLKYAHILLLLFPLLNMGCKHDTSFILKAHLTEFDSDTLLVYYQYPQYKLDTIIGQGGLFEYKIEPDTTLVFFVYLNDSVKIPIVAQKGERTSLSGTITDFSVSGTGENFLFNEQLKALREQTTREEEIALADSFMSNNPYSFSNIYLMDKYFMHDSAPDYKRINTLIKNFAGVIKDTPYFTNLQEQALRLNKEYLSFPYFTIKDKFGKTLTRELVRDKYVLISFWASWNKESVAEQDSLPKLLKQLKKSPFMVVSYSLDMDKAQWLDACERDTTNWRQVCDFMGWEGALVHDLAIHTIPYNILVTPAKRIIGTQLSREEVVHKVKAETKKK